MRRLILTRLYDYLEQHYSVTRKREEFVTGAVGSHEIAALLAFKSDPSLNELKRALDRLDEGSFGRCISCKGMIARELLHEDPTRRLCDRCEQVISHPIAHLYSSEVAL
jgi:RNA polymerase-binding transcription factor DksA